MYEYTRTRARSHTHTHTHTHTERGRAIRYACVTRALRIAVLLVCLSRGRSGITRGSTAFDNLTAFCNLSFLLPFTHHLGFPILGRSNIDVRFTVVTVKFIRGLFVMISPDMKKQNIPRGKTILLLTMQFERILFCFYFIVYFFAKRE